MTANIINTTMWKIQLVVYGCLSLVSLFGPVCSQEACSSGLVGFTALTPEQLREEIRESIQKYVSEPLEAIVLDSEGDGSLSSIMDAIESMNNSLRLSQEKLINKLETSLQDFIQQKLSEAVKNVTEKFQEAISSLNVSITSPTTTTTNPPPFTDPTSPTTTKPPPLTDPTSPTTTKPPPPLTDPTSPPFPPPPGSTSSNPAISCVKVQETIVDAPSGFYWINGKNGGSVSVYCDMIRTCGDLTGGWMRVANIDMTNTSQQCPGDFVEVSRPEPPKRVCVSNSNLRGCYSHSFPVAGTAGYGNVCGKIIGYQNRTTNAFFPYHVMPSLTIDDIFMDGIVLTQGNPRFHIWSFIAALDETLGHLSGCLCSHRDITSSATVPDIVGEDYFCDTGSEESVEFIFYDKDPLWDGSGCGPDSSCCRFNNPPWFFKGLSAPSTDAIEMRVCRDANSSNEDIPFEMVELYVR